MDHEHVRPTLGCIDHVSIVPEGERWAQVRYRVFGYWSDPRFCNTRTSEPHAALMRVDGTWYEVPSYACIVPDECSLSQQQLSDAMAFAGITNVLPWVSPNHWHQVAAIVYSDTPARPAEVREEWKPRAPIWRGGKPWR